MLVVICTILLAMVGPVYAQSGGFAEARLLSKSSSNKTAIFNVGDLDSIKAGDFGVVLRRVNTQDALDLRVIPVARGRVVKTGKTSSLWYLYNIADSQQLIMRDSYILTTEGMTMPGRRLLESTRLTVVDEKKLMPTTLENKAEGDKNLLAKKKDNYSAYRSAHKLGEEWAKDGALIDGDEWVSIDRSGNQKYAKSLWRSPYEKDFAEKKRLETFEKMVATYLQRINDPSFDYGKFYAEQSRDETGEYRVSVSQQTEYQAFLENEKKKMSDKSRLYRKLLEKGQGWSEDYSDEELANVISEAGISYEQERRRNIVTNSFDWQIMGSLGINLLDNENRVDQANSTAAKWNWEIGADWFPAPKHDTLQRLSLWSTFRNSRDGISVGNQNAQVTENSFGFGVTWHPLNNPFVREKNILFLSLGMRTGFMKLATPTNGEEANYSVFSLPTLTGGLKYTFRSGLGVRIAASLEKILLDRVRMNQPSVTLPSRAEFIDGRLSLGLTKLY